MMPNYREALPEDDSSLLKLTSSAIMPGVIQLMTTRQPSFFNLVRKRGLSKVIVAVQGNEIIGSICVTHEKVVVNKDFTELFYISDFRVAQLYRNKGIGLQLTNEAVKYLESQDADFAFLNVSKGNKCKETFLEYVQFDNKNSF